MDQLTQLSRNIAAVNESATLAVDAKAKRLKQSGKPIISYAAGEPDFPTPENIVAACQEAAAKPANHVYTPAAGLPDFREAIAEKTRRDSALAVSASQVLVTNGGKHAVYTACQVLLNPGDEVIVPAPYWTTYPEVVSLTGAKFVPVLAGVEEDYLAGVEALEAARTPRTKALILVSPSNPSGAVYSLEQLRQIGQWAKQNRIWIIADEIYQNIYYPGRTAPTIAEAVPEIADQLVLVNGLAKTYAMTGWRIGWLVGPQAVADAAIKLQSHLCSNVSDIMQRAGLEALAGPQDSVAQMKAAFARRRELILEEVRKIPGVSVPKPEGAFYVYPDFSAWLGRELAGRTVNTTLELAEVLLEEAMVAAVPGEAFGTQSNLRFSYALDDASLLEGMQRLQEFFRQNV